MNIGTVLDPLREYARTSIDGSWSGGQQGVWYPHSGFDNLVVYGGLHLYLQWSCYPHPN